MKNITYKTKDFLILTENFKLDKNIVKEVSLAKEMIGFVFYASGSISINVSIDKKEKKYLKQAGIASSFYYSPGSNTTIQHEIASEKPINKLSLFIEPNKLKQLVGEEQTLENILNPRAPFVGGNSVSLNPDMYFAIRKIMSYEFSGTSHTLFLESQAYELLANYLHEIDNHKVTQQKFKAADIDKLHFTKELIHSKIESPPSLNELAKLSGLNTFKLKNGFKELFGLPVYQYIKNEKLQLAFKAIQEKNHTVQEAAWLVGYDSLGSFSNAFYKKFGIRPSSLHKESLSNKS
jgi:AraC family transcriptional regulator, transcriptional activator of the genes for pyochelin and ferripyochelin receptors